MDVDATVFPHDHYPNGSVLVQKNYKLFGSAYRVFLVGLSLDFLAFLTRSNTYCAWTQRVGPAFGSEINRHGHGRCLAGGMWSDRNA